MQGTRLAGDQSVDAIRGVRHAEAGSTLQSVRLRIDADECSHFEVSQALASRAVLQDAPLLELLSEAAQTIERQAFGGSMPR